MAGDHLKLEKPASRHGWWWGTSEDSGLSGPFESETEARDAWWAEDGETMYRDYLAEVKDGLHEEEMSREEFKADHEWVQHMNRPAISTDIFDAEQVLDAFEEKNELAVWGDVPPGIVPAEQKRELEKFLADALYRWAEKHDYWKQFRGLE